MNDAEWSEYCILNDQLDQCAPCRDAQFAFPKAPAPGRPYLCPQDNPLLFIGECPPSKGGFWRLQNQDFLRHKLLQALGYPLSKQLADLDRKQSLEWFVGSGFFFIQTLKWPGRSYAGLRRDVAELAIRHAVDAHVGPEVALIKPRAVVCLGTAAWDACSYLQSNSFKRWRSGQGTLLRLKHHRIGFGHETVPLHMTYLPARRSKNRTKIMKEDISVFIDCLAGRWECERVNRAELSFVN